MLPSDTVSLTIKRLSPTYVKQSNDKRTYKAGEIYHEPYNPAIIPVLYSSNNELKRPFLCLHQAAHMTHMKHL